MLSMLTSAPAELKLVIAGNHDISLDAEYYYSQDGTLHRPRLDENPAERPEAIKALYTSPEARAAGIVYLEEGMQTFKLSTGAKFTVYTSPYQPEFCRWAFSYPRNEDRFNDPQGDGNPVPDFPGVDLMLTHGPPMGILDQVVRSRQSVGCEFLRRAVERAKPRLHVFGHIHEGYGALRADWGKGRMEEIKTDPEEVLEGRCAYYDATEEGDRGLRFGEETLFVNASVVTVRYNPINAPWVVDLDLPAADDQSDAYRL